MCKAVLKANGEVVSEVFSHRGEHLWRTYLRGTREKKKKKVFSLAVCSCGLFRIITSIILAFMGGGCIVWKSVQDSSSALWAQGSKAERQAWWQASYSPGHPATLPFS